MSDSTSTAIYCEEISGENQNYWIFDNTNSMLKTKQRNIFRKLLDLIYKNKCYG